MHTTPIVKTDPHKDNPVTDNKQTNDMKMSLKKCLKSATLQDVPLPLLPSATVLFIEGQRGGYLYPYNQYSEYYVGRS